MRKTCLLISLITVLNLPVSAQATESIVTLIDELTLDWDKEAEKLKTYEGLETYCRVKPYRDKTVKLLNQIHHYDSILYNIVSEKFDTESDAEAKATLEDIEKLETGYTTKSFLGFLHKECGGYNFIESNLSGEDHEKQYDKEKTRLEKELVKYVGAITGQIDVIDEHIHHLEGL